MSAAAHARTLALLALAVGALAAGVLGAPLAAQASAGGRARVSVLLPLRTRGAALARFARAVNMPGSSLYRRYQRLAVLARRFGARKAERVRVLRYLRAHGADDARIDATGLLAQASFDPGAVRRLFGRGSLPDGSRPGVMPLARRVGHLDRAPVRLTVPRALRGTVTGVIASAPTPRAAAAAQAAAKTFAVAAPRAAFPGAASRGAASLGAASPAAATPTTTAPSAPAPSIASSAYAGPDGTPRGCAAGTAPAGFAPNEYLDAYNLAALHRAGDRGQGERVALIEIDGFKRADVNAFAACFDLPRPRIKVHPVGAARPLAPGGEATLDLEVLDAAAPRLTAVDVYETGPDAADVLRALTAALQLKGPAPNVISVSLGLCEKRTLAAIGKAGIAATEAALEEAAAAGISVLAAAGDSGSAGCLGSGAQARAPLPQLAVMYPASSPWVTAVGGVNLELSAANRIESQRVWNDATVRPGLAGGGGLSTLFARPRYQRGVVAPNQRSVPDVALLADIAPGYDAYCTASADCAGRGWMTFGGTSAAAPLLAGGFALVDQRLRHAHLQPLGLANPLLYRFARAPLPGAPLVDDVTVGSNDVGPFIQADHEPLGCCAAAVGFDQASGWGGVDLASLAARAAQVGLPVGTVTLRAPAARRLLSSGALSALVRCSERCDLRLQVRVSVSGRAVLSDRSPTLVLRARSTRRVTVSLTHGQLARLRRALARALRVGAALEATLSDPAGNIERRSRTLRLRVGSRGA